MSAVFIGIAHDAIGGGVRGGVRLVRDATGHLVVAWRKQGTLISPETDILVVPSRCLEQGVLRAAEGQAHVWDLREAT
eukprot:4108856-Pleurochrysis_carterae.AAC.1